jgi:hypothetical protein
LLFVALLTSGMVISLAFGAFWQGWWFLIRIQP